MDTLTLDTARKIVAAGFAKSAEKGFNPLAIVVLDMRGAMKAVEAQDGTSLTRVEIAHGKAYGSLALGMGSRAIFKRVQEQPYFIDAVNALAHGKLVPLPGGALIRNAAGAVIGAVGISGDTSDNDEIALLAGVEAVGLKADIG